MSVNVESFMDVYSQKIIVKREKIRHKGEDGFAFCINDRAAMISVFDGCGGIGARQYAEYQNHTGAYIAARILSGTIKNWFENWSISEVKGEEYYLADSIKENFDNALMSVQNSVQNRSKLKGGMQKDFPSTAAICVIRQTQDSLQSNVIWCGDSRVYYMNNKGLYQLSDDDIDGQDAMTNLYNDGAMTNVISASKPYKLNEFVISDIKKKGMYFVATDGCFGYLLSPMHFEYLLLSTLVDSKSFDEWEKELDRQFSKYGADDSTFCGVLVGFDNFEELKAYYRQRAYSVYDEYIRDFDIKNSEERFALWEAYREGYEKLMGGGK